MKLCARLAVYSVSFRFGNSFDPKRKHDDERNEEADDGATDDGLTQIYIGIWRAQQRKNEDFFSLFFILFQF